MQIKLWIDGIPPQQDAKRANAVMLKDRNGGFSASMRRNAKGNLVPVIRMTTRPEVQSWRDAASWQIKKQMAGRQPLSGLIRLEILLFVARRKKYGIGAAQLVADTPDYDNAAKIITDAVKSIAFGDDRNVCWGTVQRWCVSSDGFGPTEPHVEITATEINEYGEDRDEEA